MPFYIINTKDLLIWYIHIYQCLYIYIVCYMDIIRAYYILICIDICYYMLNKKYTIQ